MTSAVCKCNQPGCSAPPPDHLDTVPVYVQISTPAQALLLSQVQAVIRSPEMLVPTQKPGPRPAIPQQREQSQQPSRDEVA